jgi:hypothetical protein
MRPVMNDPATASAGSVPRPCQTATDSDQGEAPPRWGAEMDVDSDDPPPEDPGYGYGV